MQRLLFVILCFSMSLLGAKGDFKSPEIGKPAPSFEGVDSKGKKIQLSQFKGKVVVLEWLNHGCPFVKKHYESKNMQKTQSRLTKDGVVWLSVISSAPGKQGHMDSKEANQVAIEKGASATGIVLDPEGEIGRLYGAKVTPHMFLIDKKGLLAYKGAMDSIRSTDTDDIPKATNYVLAAYDAVKSGKPVKKASTDPYGCSVKYK